MLRTLSSPGSGLLPRMACARTIRMRPTQTRQSLESTRLTTKRSSSSSRSHTRPSQSFWPGPSSCNSCLRKLRVASRHATLREAPAHGLLMNTNSCASDKFPISYFILTDLSVRGIMLSVPSEKSTDSLSLVKVCFLYCCALIDMDSNPKNKM